MSSPTIPLTTTITLPLTYSDLVCVSDADPFASETTSDLQNLQQDVYHVLIQKKGGNPDDPTRGLDLPSLLGAPTTELDSLAHLIDSELGDDDRITSSHTQIIDNGDSTFAINITLEVGPAVLPLNFIFNGNELQPVI